MSLIPQGTVLGSVPFSIYVTNLAHGIKSTTSQFPEDTRKGGKASATEDRDGIQMD